MGLGTGVGPTRREDKKNTTTPCAQREWDALLISKGHEDIPSPVPCLEGRGAAADGNPAPARDTSHPTAEPKAL